MNSIKYLFLLLLFIFTCSSSGAVGLTIINSDTAFTWDTINVPDSLIAIAIAQNPEITKFSSADSANTKKYKGKKLIAAVLAFPFPFGLLGLHRVFLGTKPYIPFVYIGTLGGCFLILPIIDFVAILSANEETFMKFENNPKVFMWSH